MTPHTAIITHSTTMTHVLQSFYSMFCVHLWNGTQACAAATIWYCRCDVTNETLCSSPNPYRCNRIKYHTVPYTRRVHRGRKAQCAMYDTHAETQETEIIPRLHSSDAACLWHSMIRYGRPHLMERSRKVLCYICATILYCMLARVQSCGSVCALQCVRVCAAV